MEQFREIARVHAQKVSYLLYSDPVVQMGKDIIFAAADMGILFFVPCAA